MLPQHLANSQELGPHGDSTATSFYPPGLAQLIALCRNKSLFALTGAGISTAAGLPDYRGEGSSGVKTVDIDLFTSDPMWQRWVWQRNQMTWRSLDQLEPTPAHRALASLEQEGHLIGVATQNIDGLDEKAGLKNLALMHGTYHLVDCMQCGRKFPRQWLDEQLRERNPHLIDDPYPSHIAVLAEADLNAAQKSDLILVTCPYCDGALKPDVVFFGESLPTHQMEHALHMAELCDVILILGTSVKVSTAVWVAERALANEAKVVIINRGPTDLDDVPGVALRIDGDVQDYLGALAGALHSER